TAAVRPETRIVEGNGLAAPRLGMGTGDVLVNWPDEEITRTVFVGRLFAGFGSMSGAMTRAEFVKNPVARECAVIVIPALVAGSIVPMVQATVLPTCEQDP